MKNYTTQTAALKATTVDTRLLDAKRIDTEKLFINDKSVNVDDYKLIRTDTVLGRDNVLISDGYDDDIYISFEPTTPSGYYGADGWYPIQLFINGNSVMCEKIQEAGPWSFVIGKKGDDLSQIYGGVVEGTPITIIWQEVKYYK